MDTRMNYKEPTDRQARVTGFWELDVGIPADDGFTDALDKGHLVDAIVGYPSHSSGGGFGYRDLQYAVATPWKAKRLAIEIRELLGIPDELVTQLPQGEAYVGCYYVPPNFVWKYRQWKDE